MKGTLETAIAAITEMQPEEQNAVWMVGEQLKDILRGEPELAEVVYQDLERKEMDLASCEKEIKKYADAHKTGNFACVPPQVAEGIIREFYGLPGRGAAASPPARRAAPTGGICLNLEDFI